MLTLHGPETQSQASEQLVDLQHNRLKFNSSTLFKCSTRRQTCFNAAAAVMFQHSWCSRCNRNINITENILMFGSWTRTGSELVLPLGVCWHKLSHHRHEAQKKQKVPPSSVISYFQTNRLKMRADRKKNRMFRSELLQHNSVNGKMFNVKFSACLDSVRHRTEALWQPEYRWGMRVGHTQGKSCESTASLQGQSTAQRKNLHTFD